MKTILKIGYSNFLLPAKTNVHTLLQMLSGAVEVGTQYIERAGDTAPHYVYVRGEPMRLELVVARDEHIIDPTKSRRIPEKTGGPY